MRINGTDNFLSEIRKSPLTQLIGTEAQVQVAQPNDLKQDSVNISGDGKRIRFRRMDVPNLVEGKTVQNSDPVIQLMNKSMLETEAVLNRMNELAIAAKDEKLSLEKRIDMQIEMEELRFKLAGGASGMAGKLASMSGQEPKAEIMGYSSGPMAVMSGDISSVLERARERIKNGEEWNIREGYEQFQKISNNGLGAELGELVEGRWYKSDNEDIPTVLEKLQQSGTVILMDANSAAKGAERIEAQITDLRNLRDEFAVVAQEQQINGNQEQAQGGIKRMSNAPIAHKMTASEEAVMIARINGVDFGNAQNTQKPEKTETEFETPLGSMKFTKEGSRPRLTDPKNKAGQMFVKIQSFLDNLADKLAKNFISEEVENKFSWINVD